MEGGAVGHNFERDPDELFNIYYVIFYELWTFADFDRLCKLGINKQKII
jgi:hypothetical protein